MYEDCARILTPEGKWSTATPLRLLAVSVMTHALLIALLANLPALRTMKPRPSGTTFELQMQPRQCSLPDQQETADAAKVALLEIPIKATLANSLHAEVDNLPRPKHAITPNRLKPQGKWKPPTISSPSQIKGPSEPPHLVSDNRQLNTDDAYAVGSNDAASLHRDESSGPTGDSISVESIAGSGALELGSAIQMTALSSPTPCRPDKVQLKSSDADKDSAYAGRAINTDTPNSTPYLKLKPGNPCDRHLLLGHKLWLCTLAQSGSSYATDIYEDFRPSIRYPLRAPLFIWAHKTGFIKAGGLDTLASDFEISAPNGMTRITETCYLKLWLSSCQSISSASGSVNLDAAAISLREDGTIINGDMLSILNSIITK